MSKPIDWDKPLRTVEGHRPVRRLCTDYRNQFPVVVLIEFTPGTDCLYVLSARGEWNGTVIVENVPDERELWVNVYDYGFRFHNSMEEAEYAFQQLKDARRIARIRVPYRPGQFDE